MLWGIEILARIQKRKGEALNAYLLDGITPLDNVFPDLYWSCLA